MSRANTSEPFDRWSHDRAYRGFSVRARGLDWSDYKNSFHCERHSTWQARKGGYPSWLADDKKVRAVVCEKLIGRPAESIDDLRTAAHQRYVRFMQGNLWKRAGERHYCAVQKNGNILMLYMKMIWLYRRGFDAKEIAREVGMSHVAVRQRLLRLNRIASELFPS